MKKGRLAIQILALLLVGTLLAVVFFGCSDFNFRGTAALTGTENLARNAAPQTEQGGKTASRLVDGDIDSVWKPGSRKSEILLDFGRQITFDTIVLREVGWNVKQFSLYRDAGVNEKGEALWERIIAQDKIEDYRCLTFPAVTANQVKLCIEQSNTAPELAELEIYQSTPIQNTSFTPSAYLTCRNCALAVDAKPGDSAYLDPAYFDVIRRVTLIGTVNMQAHTGEMVMEKMPGREETYMEVTLRHLRNVAGDRDVEVFVSAFGGNKYVYEEPLKSQSIQNALDFLLKYDLDGFDFDWEFPETLEQYQQLSDYIVAMKRAFAPYGKKISTAWYAWDISLTREAIQAIDYCNVMGYDEYDQDGNICSFMSGALQPVQYFLELGFRPEQLVLGVPYYTRAYIDGTLTERHYDHPDVRLPAFGNTSNGFVFNGPQLIRDKTAYAMAENLGGVFMWSLLSDRGMEEEGCLTRVMQEVMQERLALQPEGGQKS